ncbi:Nicotine adenine dinucleotide glycohydrolase (NADase) [Lutibacter oricola]|uniref:Nicotine adenine dinucleotide glycohydrolase (NADase) n=2 Tax=Lutibacter oricola TaxID=762486 RepID=A0A1H3HD94_9FLAO|nr:Nicotine adenine dinucleotide glycohydrolase (NADase) [Lutibacter oricola]
MGQNVLNLNPIEIRDSGFDFTQEYIEKFNSAESIKNCEKVWSKIIAENRDIDNPTDKEKEILKYCDETKENPWNVDNGGCSWYCGGGLDINSATSELQEQNGINYKAENIHDLNYKTAWIEGVNGYGIGESITYDFPPENPRITKIIVVNGYVKSENSWRNNSRVKRLKVYLNNKEFAILNLKDIKFGQVFEFKPIGIQKRENEKELKKMNRWNLRFEIMDIYKGEKYDDTAITEIYFDGIDVH